MAIEHSPLSELALNNMITQVFSPYLTSRTRKATYASPETEIIYPLTVTNIPGSIMRDVGGTDTFRTLTRKSEVSINSTFAFLHGPKIKIDKKTYLFAPTPLGDGAYYTVSAANEFPGGKPVLMRVANSETPQSVYERDVRSLSLPAWQQFPEIPKLINHSEVLGNRIIILDDEASSRMAWTVYETDKLSTDNLYRLATMQLFAMKRWLKEGAVYTDWQPEELLLWENNPRDYGDSITGFRVMDWQVQHAWPNNKSCINLYKQLNSMYGESNHTKSSYLNTSLVHNFLYINGLIKDHNIPITDADTPNIFQKLKAIVESTPPNHNHDPYDSKEPINALKDFFNFRINPILEKIGTTSKLNSLKRNFEHSTLNSEELLKSIGNVMAEITMEGIKTGAINNVVIAEEGEYLIRCKNLA